METLQTRSYVLTSWDSKHQSSSCILHPLQFHNLTDWESTVQRVKRIQFRCDQSMNKSLKCISVQEFPDAADIVKLMESTLAHLPDLLVHATDYILVALVALHNITYKGNCYYKSLLVSNKIKSYNQIKPYQHTYS